MFFLILILGALGLSIYSVVSGHFGALVAAVILLLGAAATIVVVQLREP